MILNSNAYIYVDLCSLIVERSKHKFQTSFESLTISRKLYGFASLFKIQIHMN